MWGLFNGKIFSLILGRLCMVLSIRLSWSVGFWQPFYSLPLSAQVLNTVWLGSHAEHKRQWRGLMDSKNLLHDQPRWNGTELVVNFPTRVRKQWTYWHWHAFIYSVKMYWVPTVGQALCSGLKLQRFIPLNSTEQRNWIKSHHSRNIQMWHSTILKEIKYHSWVNMQSQKLFCSFVC